MNMQKKTILSSLTAAAAAVVLMAATTGDTVMTKENGVTVVNTTTLAKNVRGYMGNTPVKIYIKGNKVTKVEALKNQESPKYFALAKKLLSQYEGKTVSKARKLSVDAVSGATLSSKALKKNVEEGLDYYMNHK